MLRSLPASPDSPARLVDSLEQLLEVIDDEENILEVVYLERLRKHGIE